MGEVRKPGAASNPRATRTARAIWLAVAVTIFLSASPISARPSAALVNSLTITGRGFGHGIGLSQWGAEERATAGQSHRTILAFYYPGTTIGKAPDRDVRIFLAERPRLIVGSATNFAIVDADNLTIPFAAGHYAVSATGVVGGRPLAMPITVEPGRTPVMLGGTRYRGTLKVSVDGDKVQAVNTLNLEQYVGDVVSFENPAYWPAEALEAQAIASRSYALANLKPGAAWDLYPDDRSQNYGGLRKEYATALAATAATRHEVLLYRGAVVNALFSASNGGLTGTTRGVWQGSALPYYQVRPDPFDARSPASRWGPVRIGMSSVRRDFPAIPDGVVHVSIATNDADRATSITFLGEDGSTIEIDGPAFQGRLGLRSTFLSVAPKY